MGRPGKGCPADPGLPGRLDRPRPAVSGPGRAGRVGWRVTTRPSWRPRDGRGRLTATVVAERVTSTGGRAVPRARHWEVVGYGEQDGVVDQADQAGQARKGLRTSDHGVGNALSACSHSWRSSTCRATGVLTNYHLTRGTCPTPRATAHPHLHHRLWKQDRVRAATLTRHLRPRQTHTVTTLWRTRPLPGGWVWTETVPPQLDRGRCITGFGPKCRPRRGGSPTRAAGVI